VQKIVIEIVNDFFSERKIPTEINKNQSQNEHGYFNVTGSTVQKIGRAQAIFWEVGGAYEYL